ncbi:lytic polysaccharide monooxygenase, partial [Lentithecium fluviatile CBS 122367]
CGCNAFPLLNPLIKTAAVVADEQIGFHVSSATKTSASSSPGPAYVFLSKLPAHLKDLGEYDGSGEWFKIGYTGPLNSTTWASFDQKSVKATVPVTTPPGKFLARIEQ